MTKCRQARVFRIHFQAEHAFFYTERGESSFPALEGGVDVRNSTARGIDNDILTSSELKLH